jgi:ketosteroid isomerase-like protein
VTGGGGGAAAEAARFVADFGSGWAEPEFEQFVAYFCERFDPAVRLSQPLAPDGVGHEALREQFRRLFILIPDLSGTVRRWAANENEIFIELELRGTLGRKAVSWTACDLITLRDGLAIERRSFFDPTPLIGATLRRPSAWPRLLRSAMPRAKPGA